MIWLIHFINLIKGFSVGYWCVQIKEYSIYFYSTYISEYVFFWTGHRRCVWMKLFSVFQYFFILLVLFVFNVFVLKIFFSYFWFESPYLSTHPAWEDFTTKVAIPDDPEGGAFQWRTLWPGALHNCCIIKCNYFRKNTLFSFYPQGSLIFFRW